MRDGLADEGQRLSHLASMLGRTEGQVNGTTAIGATAIVETGATKT
jgi:hypothetical protein